LKGPAEGHFNAKNLNAISTYQGNLIRSSMTMHILSGSGYFVLCNNLELAVLCMLLYTIFNQLEVCCWLELGRKEGIALSKVWTLTMLSTADCEK
jgi:hypothetical protein